MKKLILLFLAVIVVSFVCYQNKTVIAAEANQLLYQSPCDTPKTFRIGTIDSRFNLSKTELVADAEEAGSAWKNDKGMTLMHYDPNAAMPINMIYDQRQYLNSQINNLDSQVNQQKNSLKPEISDYEQKVATFKQQSNDLDAQIQYWNSKGGAPQDVYTKLLAQQQSLQQQAMQLQKIANQLNQSTDQYNQQIQQLNQKVDTYNTVLQNKPEEGLYSRNGASETIAIYFNNSQRELIHTLAHEMGHSLGLDHNSNPQSIMYPYTNLVVTPSTDDQNALAAVCQKRSVFIIADQNIALMIDSLKQKLNNTLTH